jgi:biotin transport system substrate-specific component
MNTPALTLAGLGLPQSAVHRAIYYLLLAILGSVAIGVAAQVQVPFYPVPMTLQTLAVLIVGGAYGWRLGAATVLLYIAGGAAGIPLFHGGTAGLGVLAGPTGGYLWGFVIAAGIVGWLAERGFDRHPGRMLIATLLGGAILYIPGILWLTLWLMQAKTMYAGAAFDAALAGGLYPFIFGDLLKAALAAMAFPAAWTLLTRK